MTQREQYEKYYALPGAKYPESQRIVLAAADAYDAAEAAGGINQDQLRILTDAVSHPSSRVWGNIISQMRLAVSRWKEVQDALEHLMNHPKSHVRFAALCSLSKDHPSDFVERLIKVGLKDKSSKVRWKAADKANSCNCGALLPDIETALNSETNLNARKAIQFDYLFLRDGHIVRDKGGEKVNISIRLQGGGTVISVSRSEYEERGVERIVADYHASRQASRP